MSSHSPTIGSGSTPEFRTAITGEGLFDQFSTILKPLASLKLTVTLFAFSILLILVGTLAQYYMSMQDVIAVFFRSWIARVDLQVFFPPSLFPPTSFPFFADIPGFIFIPGGKMLGYVMFANLFAAHLLRFKVQATGRRLWIGAVVTLIGALLTGLIIISGHNQEGLQGLPIISWDALWMLIRVSVVLAWIGVVALLIATDRSRAAEFWSLTVLAVVFGIAALYLIAKGDTAKLSESSLRILWQLIQGGLAGVLLLVGCILVFKRRGGIVLIHAGVGLMMLGELLVGTMAVEEQLTLREGETSVFTRDIRDVELTIIDRSNPEHDKVVAIPMDRLRKDKDVSDEQLPFDIRLVEFFKNSNLRRLTPDDENRATSGVAGKAWFVEPRRSVGGAGAGNEINVASAYIKVLPKSNGNADEEARNLETFLVSQFFGDSDVILENMPPPIPEFVNVDGKKYEMFLRFKRNYGKSYRIKLDDIQKNDYVGTSTPMDYSSWITLSDESRGVENEKIRIWMNNPLRYAGETFYQSDYQMLSDGSELTKLSVVTNFGWMIPYVACMLVLIGMLYHFLLTLVRFINRVANQERTTPSIGFKSGIALPVGLALFFGIYVASKSRVPEVVHNEMRMDKFAQIPVVYRGRIKPIDTLSRNALRALSDKQKLYTPVEGSKRKKKEPSLVWMLDTVTHSDAARDHNVFRIDNIGVLDAFGLERRKGFLYSINDLSKGIEQFEEKVDKARAVAQEDKLALTSVQRKLIETDSRLREFERMRSSFMPIPFPSVPTREMHEKDPEGAKAAVEEIARLGAEAPRLNRLLMARNPPLVVPISSSEELWMPFAGAINEAFIKQIFSGEKPDRRVRKWSEIVDAYSSGDAKGFNRAVIGYLKDLEQDPPKDYDPKKVKFEVMFNSFQPYIVAMTLYVVVFLLTAFSWIRWFEPLRRSALSVALVAFAVHTFAIVAGMIISGRPPVTNLTTSAVFVGWGMVLLALIIEMFILRLGIAGLVASVVGFSTLIIAHLLAFGGDTFSVLQAVLDTQFWLATHVVCITLGYAATFLAGAFAIAYVVARFVVRKGEVADTVDKSLSSIIYGTICFAMFFSFVGTVLGGLWADDSWGRFWGWDPKENGALMIVLWNALILHARWGGMIRTRGLALLAILGNIVTAWSWFGVNELGIGLHNYGFTEGVLKSLGIFAISQLAIVLLGLFALSSKPATAT